MTVVEGAIVGDYFNIDADDLQTIQGIFDDMLTTFGSPCKVVYTTTETVCPNCIINPRTGESTNRYKSGGPVPFSAGEVCPVCDGTGKIPGTEQTATLTMVIDWIPKPWMNIDATTNNLIRIPAGMVSTRGFIADLPKIIQASYVILDSTNPLLANEYQLYGQPYITGAITGDRYFIAVWKKSE